ncbi:hypothetical protein COSO111634_31120 [Corallococcus soli]
MPWGRWPVGQGLHRRPFRDRGSRGPETRRRRSVPCPRLPLVGAACRSRWARRGRSARSRVLQRLLRRSRWARRGRLARSRALLRSRWARRGRLARSRALLRSRWARRGRSARSRVLRHPARSTQPVDPPVRLARLQVPRVHRRVVPGRADPLGLSVRSRDPRGFRRPSRSDPPVRLARCPVLRSRPLPALRFGPLVTSRPRVRRWVPPGRVPRAPGPRSLRRATAARRGRPPRRRRPSRCPTTMPHRSRTRFRRAPPRPVSRCWGADWSGPFLRASLRWSCPRSCSGPRVPTPW